MQGKKRPISRTFVVHRYDRVPCCSQLLLCGLHRPSIGGCNGLFVSSKVMPNLKLRFGGCTLLQVIAIALSARSHGSITTLINNSIPLTLCLSGPILDSIWLGLPGVLLASIDGAHWIKMLPIRSHEKSPCRISVWFCEEPIISNGLLPTLVSSLCGL